MFNFGKLGDSFYQESFKPWIENYIEHFGFDPSKGFDEIYKTSREILLKSGYDAAVEYVQTFDKEQLESIAKQGQRAGILMMMAGGALAAFAFVTLRK